MASLAIRKLRNLRDVDADAIADGETIVWDAGAEEFVPGAGGGGGGAPSGPAGGVLGGTYPNPGFAADMATQAELDAMLAQAVILAPAASVRNVIQPTAGTVIAEIIKAHAAQSVDVWNVQKSDGGKYLRVGATGEVGVGAGTYDPALYGGFLTGFVVSRAADGYWEAGGGPNFTPGAADVGVAASFFDTCIFPTASNVNADHYGFASTLRYRSAFDAYEVKAFSADALFVGTKAAGSGAQVELFSGGLNIAQTATPSTGDVTDLYATKALVGHHGTGHVATMTGLIIDLAMGGSAGPVAVSRGIFVPNVGAANVVTSYGLYMAAQSGATNVYGLYIAGGKSVFVDTLLTGRITAPADADLANSQGGWWWDQANSLPKWKGKTSGGVVVNFVPAAAGGSVAAEDVSFTPTGTIAATDVQAAIAEVASEAAAGGIPGTIVDAKGDLIAASADDTVGRLAVGTNDHVLTADSTQTLGIKWAAAAGGGIAATIVDAKGDLIAATAADTVARLAVGSNDQVLTADSAQATGIKWATPAAGGVPQRGRAVYGGVTQFSIPGPAPAGDNSTFTKSAGRAEYMPILVDNTIVIDRIVCELTTGVAASTIRIGIYNAGTDWQPTTLVANTDTGALNATAAEVGVISTTIADTTLTPGRYLIWMNASTGNHVFRCIRGNAGPLLGYPVALGGSTGFVNIYVAQAYGAPPSTGDAWTSVSVSSPHVFSWYVWVRVKTP